jgi:microcystin-dependent protein
MADPFVGEIRIFGFNFAPLGWALCDGQLLPIAQNTALFSLLGTSFGGDGRSTFGLPNFQGAVAVDQGQGAGLSPYNVGQSGGSSAVTVQTPQLPAHTHGLEAHTGRGLPPEAAPVAGGALTSSQGGLAYAPAGSAQTSMALAALTTAGDSEPHNNLMPLLVLNYCIALQGIFPPRS